MADRANWLWTLWAMVDERLASLALTLQRIVRTLRLVTALLAVGVLVVLASPVVLVLWPRYFPIAYALATVVLAIPLVLLAVLVSLPLRLKSVVRLIDKGYPENAKELAIRIAARKLRDQSIETEELLVETAINEGRKMVERYKSRGEQMAGDAAPPPGAPANP